MTYQTTASAQSFAAEHTSCAERPASHALHAELRPHNIRVTAVIAGGMRTPFLLDRFPELDAGTLQDPDGVARAIVGLLALPARSVVAELTILPMRETSWP